MEAKQILENIKNKKRNIRLPTGNEESLGPLQLLLGEWNNDVLEGRGWNMIALPFVAKPEDNFPFNYRLLMNQYNETLQFDLVDEKVPNRGIRRIDNQDPQNVDQLITTVDYEQFIKQIAAADFPVSGKAGDPNLPIHHEPGLWLNMLNETTNGLNLARLATIPHGDAVLALGRSTVEQGMPAIPAMNGLPIGVDTDLNNPYMAPYKHFHDSPFQGLFDPTQPTALLNEANKGLNIEETTVLEVDSTIDSGGISNIPFIVKQANAASMKSTFWIQKIKTDTGETEWRLQYAQVVMLDFFPRRDGLPGLIRWPHISINTMTKSNKKPNEYRKYNG